MRAAMYGTEETIPMLGSGDCDDSNQASAAGPLSMVWESRCVLTLCCDLRDSPRLSVEKIPLQESNMRDVYEVLREKEKAIARVDREIRVLRLAVPLLTDGTDIGPIPAATTGDHGTAEARTARSNKALHGAHTVTDDARCSGREAAGGVKLGTATKISARLKRLATPLLPSVS